MESQSLKAQGNAHHKAQRYTEALVSYTAALQHAGSQDEAVLHNNMAACHLKLGHHQQACVEASLCLELCPREVGTGVLLRVLRRLYVFIGAFRNRSLETFFVN